MNRLFAVFLMLGLACVAFASDNTTYEQLDTAEIDTTGQYLVAEADTADEAIVVEPADNENDTDVTADAEHADGAGETADDTNGGEAVGDGG